MLVIVGIISFIFGAFIGSFLNVVVDRMSRDEAFVSGRSKCDYCGHELKWYELIPLLSFLIQRGRTRCCNKEMSLWYPASEVLTGALTAFVAVSFVYQGVYDLKTWFISLIFAYALIVISLIDIKTGEIEIKVLKFLIFVFVFWQLWVLADSLDWRFWVLELTERALSAFVVASFYAILHFGSRGRGMGGGDVQLGFVIGLFLGATNSLIATYLAFVVGGVVALVFLLCRKRKFGQTLPFGPFMALGAIIALLWGGLITDLYLTGSLNL